MFDKFIAFVHTQGYKDVLDYCEQNHVSMEDAVDGYYREHPDYDEYDEYDDNEDYDNYIDKVDYDKYNY